MRVTVRFFGGLRDAAGLRECSLDISSGATIQQMAEQLVRRYPVLDGQQPVWNYAVNHTHVERDHVLADGDRVAIFPYIAGG
jgi:molybdopterin converting factor subunit 1